VNAQELFLSHIDTIDRITAFICRSHRLNTTAAEEFASEVKLALVMDDYDIVRKFQGRSSFATYLTTVISRLFYQHRVKEWGKWRASAEAKRLGRKAVVLERLITRDGFSLGEARQFLTTGNAPDYTAAEIDSIYARLPARQPRPVLVTEDDSSDVASEETADGTVVARERHLVAKQAAQIVDRVISEMKSDDQLILRLRFWHAKRAPEIALLIHIDQKKVYKRIDKLLASLRRELIRRGIDRSVVDDLLSAGDEEMKIDRLEGEKTDPCLSEEADGIGDGESRKSG
jgi:RNA polymerase sigma factor (sigma-70 family)